MSEPSDQKVPSDQKYPFSVDSCPVASCNLTVDLLLRSRDGMTLEAHTKNMETFNTGFPLAKSVMHTIEDVVELTEKGDVLRLLLEYSHNCDHRDLREVEIDTLVAFTYAAEKYENLFAYEACKAALREMGPKSPMNALPTMVFQAVHGQYDSIDRLAGLTMELPPKTVWRYAKASPKVFYVWTQYRDDWRVAQNEYARALKKKAMKPSERETSQLAIIRPLSKEIKSHFESHVLDVAIAVALKVHPNPDNERFEDDESMNRWYLGVKAAVDSFPRWENILASSDEGEDV